MLHLNSLASAPPTPTASTSEFLIKTTSELNCPARPINSTLTTSIKCEARRTSPLPSFCAQMLRTFLTKPLGTSSGLSVTQTVAYLEDSLRLLNIGHQRGLRLEEIKRLVTMNLDCGFMNLKTKDCLEGYFRSYLSCLVISLEGELQSLKKKELPHYRAWSW